MNPQEIFGSSDSPGRAVVRAVTSQSEGARTGENGITDRLAVGAVFLSIAVIPAVVWWVGATGWHLDSGASMVAFGFVAMLPGVLLGATALLVMLGST